MSAALRQASAPVVLGLVAVVAWQLAVTGLGIRPFVLPGPLDIAARFAENVPTVLQNALVTGANAALGLLVGSVVAVAGALLASLVRIVDAITVPVVAALSVVPIVALAPVLYTMYGAGDQTARWIVAAVAVFVPVYLNTLRGLGQVRPVHRDLMRAYGVSRARTLVTVGVPTALPFLFIGLRIAGSLAVISALVAEYFGGPVGGLGKSITSAASGSNYPLAWAYVLGAVLLGLVFSLAVIAVERLVRPRHP